MKNDAILDSILSLLQAYRNLIISNQNKKDLEGLRYLLGQIIRQYDIPKDNCHISKAAYARWTELSVDKIENFHYRDVVICNNLKVAKEYLLFKGANSKGDVTEIKPNSTFVFRQMFHEDHVIPVSLIIKEMANLAVVDKTSIRMILEGMHICILLKEEDRNISRTRNRSLNFEENLNNVYSPSGIELYT